MPCRTIVLLFLFALAPGGCSGDPAPVSPDSAVAAPDGKAASPDRSVQPDRSTPKPDTVPAKAASVCGTVEEQSGAALADHTVIVCSVINGCRTTTSSADGSVCLKIEESGDYIFHAINEAKAGKHYLEIYFPVAVTKADIAGEKKIDLGKIVVPYSAKALQTVDIKAGGAHDLGSGVSLVIGPGISNKPPLELDLKVGAGPLQKGQVNPRSEADYKGSGKLHMAVAFHPLETTFTAPVPFKFPALGLAAGAAVEVFFLNDQDGKLTKQADALESGGSIVSAAGQGIKTLGIFLVYSK